MKVHDYIKYYKESVPLDLCEAIKEYRYNYKPSTIPYNLKHQLKRLGRSSSVVVSLNH